MQKIPQAQRLRLKSITVAEAKDFYKSIATKSRMLIVVVANIDKSEIEQKIHNLLTAIPDR
ncbi:MAG: insulinase family protein [Segetibacter sp.]